jgi:solute carrier family 35 (adenosine 3'-phospho 5'-phosphosulfate transporter), member B2
MNEINLEKTGANDEKPTLVLLNDDNNNELIKAPANTEHKIKKIMSFLICFFGLQISFLLWGLMQERILKHGYVIVANKEKLAKFTNSQFLVLCNRLCGLLLSLFIIQLSSYKNFRRFTALRSIVSTKNLAPVFICSYSSLSNVLSSWFQYEALKYVSFTSQLLAKSSKSVFVMITGHFISKKHYSVNEYISVVLICVGIFLFSDINELHSSSSEIVNSTIPGIICLLGYLISDSFTSNWQDNLIKSYTMSSISLMFITNVYSCLFTFLSLIQHNELAESIEFLSNHSDISFHLFLLSLTSAIGQVFIFVTIQKFGALVFTLIMTTRQVLSILLSILIFQNSLSIQSLFGIAIIFFALFYQQILKFFTNKRHQYKSLKTPI